MSFYPRTSVALSPGLRSFLLQQTVIDADSHLVTVLSVTVECHLYYWSRAQETSWKAERT